MSSNHFSIRPMTANEIDTAIEWAAAEGWNPGLSDGECFLTADPRGFLIGLQGDQPVGVISAIRYDDSFGFIGFYIVHPDYRGQGLGIQLWQAAIKYLEGCNIGLDGVVEQQNNYRQSGFKFAYRNIRFEGYGDGKSYVGMKLQPLSSVPEDVLFNYEQAFFPTRRDHFVSAWSQQVGSAGLAMITDGQLQGYGLLRPCSSGYKIGPLFAASPAIAEALLLDLKARVPAGEPYYLDVPEPNTDAIQMAKQQGMDTVFETARMYTGTTPELPLQQIYGITSFEIG